jgi:hypothetical protein
VNHLNDPVKRLARRFASLSPHDRLRVAGNLLRWRDENESSKTEENGEASCFPPRRKSFLEKFWDEVEAAHDDGLYPTNPFAEETQAMMPYGALNLPEQCLVRLSC